jgi:hypothetical protein
MNDGVRGTGRGAAPIREWHQEGIGADKGVAPARERRRLMQRTADNV